MPLFFVLSGYIYGMFEEKSLKIMDFICFDNYK